MLAVLSVELQRQRIAVHRAVGATRTRIVARFGLEALAAGSAGAAMAFVLLVTHLEPEAASAVMAGAAAIPAVGVALTTVAMVALRLSVTADSVARADDEGSGRLLHAVDRSGVAATVLLCLSFMVAAVVPPTIRAALTSLTATVDRLAGTFVVESESLSVPAVLPPPELDSADAELLRVTGDSVDSVSVFARTTGRVTPSGHRVSVIGCDEEYFAATGFAVTGRTFSSRDVSDAKRVAVVSSDLVGSAGMSIGDDLALTGLGSFEIVGTVEPASGWDESTIAIPLSTLGDGGHHPSLSLAVRSALAPERVRETEAEVVGILVQAHPGHAEPVVTNGMRDFRSKVWGVLSPWAGRAVDAVSLLYVTALIVALVVSGVRVTAESPWFAVRRCLGATRRRVFALVVARQLVPVAIAATLALAAAAVFVGIQSAWRPSIEALAGVGVRLDLVEAIRVVAAYSAVAVALSIVPAARVAFTDPALSAGTKGGGA